MPARFSPLILAFVLFVGASAAAETASERDYRAAHGLVAKQQYRQALALYQKTLNTPPARVPTGDIHARIGDTYFRMNDFGRALAAYRKAIRDPNLSDKAQTQYWLGFCSFLVGRDAEAVDELIKVPLLYPDADAWGTTAWYWAGRASERMGKKEEAAEYYRKASGGNGRTVQGKFARKKAEAAKGK
jgi:tetratricopeptide (TPR) repeat protein